MNDPSATVRDVSPGRAEVIVERRACPRCATGRGCGAGLIAGKGSDIALTVPVADGLDVAPGDSVALSLERGLLSRGVLVLYGLPLSGLVGGAGIAALIGAGDAVAVVSITLGLVGGLAAGRRVARGDDCLSSLRPTATLRLDRHAGGSPR
jgi:sigma-E factor negative regulatory protein RseC